MSDYQGPKDYTDTGAGPAGVDPSRSARRTSAVDIGEKLFELRDYTPIPLIIVALMFAQPSIRSATVGTLLLVFGELWRVYSVAFIGSVSRTRNTATVGGNLINTGPFSMMRNPLYVGNFFITAGIAVYTGLIWFVALTVALFAFQYYCIVKHEERLLVARFGREYEEYMNTVPAWVPARIKPLVEWEWPDTFSPALRSERRTLLAIVVMLIALMVIGN